MNKQKKFLKNFYLALFEKLLKKGLLFLINVYKIFLSPFVGGSCRFFPSCSSYAKDALTHQSLKTALTLIFCRLIKCVPFGPSGYDPAPDQKSPPVKATF